MFSLENILPPIAGYLVGFFCNFLTAGRSEGQEGIIKNIYLPVGNHVILLHHWITSIFFIILLACLQAKFKFIPHTIFLFGISFFMGSIIQGLTYLDWYKILVR